MEKSLTFPIVVQWILRLSVGAVFIYAGVLKVLDTQQFALDVQNYQLTSWTISILVAVYLPWLEVIGGLALITGRLYLGSLAALLGLTTVFLAAILSALFRGLDITCGCFGKSEVGVSYPELITRDLCLMAGIIILAWFEWRRRDRVQIAEHPSALGSA